MLTYSAFTLFWLQKIQKEAACRRVGAKTIAKCCSSFA